MNHEKSSSTCQLESQGPCGSGLVWESELMLSSCGRHSDCWPDVSSPNANPSLPPFGPCARKHSLPCHQCSQVLATRTVLTRELLSTLVSVPTAVWSRSVSSWYDCSVCRVPIVYHCGAHSRSQRTAHVWFALI